MSLKKANPQVKHDRLSCGKTADPLAVWNVVQHEVKKNADAKAVENDTHIDNSAVLKDKLNGVPKEQQPSY